MYNFQLIFSRILNQCSKMVFDDFLKTANLPKPGKKWSLEDDEEEEEEDVKQKADQNKLEGLDAIQEVEEEEEVDPLDAFMKVMTLHP